MALFINPRLSDCSVDQGSGAWQPPIFSWRCKYDSVTNFVILVFQFPPVLLPTFFQYIGGSVTFHSSYLDIP